MIGPELLFRIAAAPLAQNPAFAVGIDITRGRRSVDEIILVASILLQQIICHVQLLPVPIDEHGHAGLGVRKSDMPVLNAAGPVR